MSQHSYTAEDWIPRDDMAVLIRKSPDTVKRIVVRENLTTRLDEAGRALVCVADFLRLGRLRPEDLTAGATPVESAEVLRARETITALRVQVGELTGRLGHADLLVQTLTEQPVHWAPCRVTRERHWFQYKTQHPSKWVRCSPPWGQPSR